VRVIVNVGVCDFVRVKDGVPDLDGVKEGVTDDVLDLDGVKEGVTDDVIDLDGVTEGVTDNVFDLDGVIVKLGVTDPVGVTDLVGDLVGVIVFVGVFVGLIEGVKVPVFERDDPADGVPVFDPVPDCVRD
jgi:hypothetical protein